MRKRLRTGWLVWKPRKLSIDGMVAFGLAMLIIVFQLPDNRSIILLDFSLRPVTLSLMKSKLNTIAKTLNDCSEVMDAAASQFSTGEYIDPAEVLATAKQLAKYAMRARVALTLVTQLEN
jgi:hypothetical protein